MRQKSGLAATIIKLAEPSYGYVHGNNPHHAYLLRLHGFGLVLGDLLDLWTPKAWTTEASKSLNMYPPPPKYNHVMSLINIRFLILNGY